MEDVRPNGQRAKNAIALLWVILALDIIALISGYFQYDLLRFAANGEDISIQTANANDTREQIIGILYLVIFIISAITFIQWFRRAYYNLHLKTEYLSYTEGWAAGAWFVPIICLYRPYQIMKELYRETDSQLLMQGSDVNQRLSTSLLGWWWALWIISNFIGQSIFRTSWQAETMDELISTTVASMVSNVVGIPLALLAIKVIKDYSDVEPLLSEIRDEETING